MSTIPLNLRSLLDGWNGENIRYCHWKSNEHLVKGMEGKTDLDILVDPALPCGQKGFGARFVGVPVSASTALHYPQAKEFLIPSDVALEETEDRVKRIVWDNL